MFHNISYTQFVNFVNNDIVEIESSQLLKDLFLSATKHTDIVLTRLKNGEAPSKLFESLKGSGIQVSASNDFISNSNLKRDEFNNRNPFEEPGKSNSSLVNLGQIVLGGVAGFVVLLFAEAAVTYLAAIGAAVVAAVSPYLPIIALLIVIILIVYKICD